MKIVKKLIIVFFAFILVGFLIPERVKIPVVGAGAQDWNHDTFWYEPWGKSGVHKGIDIFGKIGTGVTSTTDGIVLYAGQIKYGGNVVIVLGPKWRFHYFAHLQTTGTSMLSFVSSGEQIGTLGDSGNAKGKPPHLHYSIVRLIPVLWKIDSSTQGYKKMFFINPSSYLLDSEG